MFGEHESITVIKGIGPKKALAYNELGIYTINDLLNYYPCNYKDRGTRKAVSKDLNGNKILTNALYLGGASIKYIKKNFSVTVLPFSNEDIKFSAVYYNQPYRKSQLTPHKEYCLYGTVSEFNGALCLSSPEAEDAQKNDYLTEGLYAVYPLPFRSPLRQKEIAAAVKYTLEHTEITEELPFWISARLELPEKAALYRYLHRPKSQDEIEICLNYRKLIGFLRFFIRVDAIKGRGRQKAAVLSDQNIHSFLSRLSFTLTGGQRQAIADIAEDIASGTKMNRLVQGDVGSGKTAVAAAAAFMAADSGYQAAVTAPTEILAKQHYLKYKPIFEESGIGCALVYSAMSRKERQCAIKEIESGRAKVVFGTHALFSKDIIYNNLALIVIDEQQRFGVSQRALLEAKGIAPHVLVMSATPIPRTLSLSLYKDLDISELSGLPVGRKPIKTVTANSSMDERIYNFIRTNAERGFKSYIVCPAIDEESMENVNAVFEQASKVLKPHRVLCLTGETSEDEKNRVMDAFAFGGAMVLIATTVIEVGIDVPEATVMLIKGSERFGLAQLHQLRGRVGRGSEQSWCILHTDNDSERVTQRLEILKRTTDGFEIAREDLKIRGEGEFFGIRQSGKGSSIIFDALENEVLFFETEKIYQKLIESDQLKDKAFLKKLIKDAAIETSGIVLN